MFFYHDVQASGQDEDPDGQDPDQVKDQDRIGQDPDQDQDQDGQDPH